MTLTFYLLNYTLSFLMWLVIGRILLELISGGRENVILGFFVKFTEPMFNFVKKLFPFLSNRYAVAFAVILTIIILRIFLIKVSPEINKL